MTGMLIFAAICAASVAFLGRFLVAISRSSTACRRRVAHVSLVPFEYEDAYNDPSPAGNETYKRA